MSENLNEKQFIQTVEIGPDSQEKYKAKFLEKVKSIFSRLGVNFESDDGQEKEAEIKEQLDEKEPMEKGKEDYEDLDDNLFVETQIDYKGQEAYFKMVAQSDPNYDPAYSIDYEKEMPDWQKHAERLLKREAIVGQKFDKFTEGRSVSADTIESAETKAGQDMYLLKISLASSMETKQFGYAEGRRLAETLLHLQYKLDASGMINEIKQEQGYETTYELENEFSEDIYNHFDGYVENAKNALNDQAEDEKISQDDAEVVLAEMETYRTIIEEQQLKKDEYSLAHNNAYLDNLTLGEVGQIYLKDWSNVGTTQNRELSIVNDLGQAFESARDELGDEKAEEFILGVKDKLEEFYESKYEEMGEKEKGQHIAEAIINLTKLRAF